MLDANITTEKRVTLFKNANINNKNSLMQFKMSVTSRFFMINKIDDLVSKINE